MFDRLRAMLGVKARSVPSTLCLRWERNGFFVPALDQVIRWKDVERVTCFKQDLLTTDLICMEIVTRIPGIERIELNEDMLGFDDFCVGMSTFLPDERKNWLCEIITPAFATNALVIYGKM